MNGDEEACVVERGGVLFVALLVAWMLAAVALMAVTL